VSMPETAIRLKDVSKFYKLYDSKRDRFREAFDPWRRKRFREFYALRGIDLDVKKGEILGVVGRNGAGKSTLLKVLSGVIQANSGQVEVNGRVSALLELGAGLNPNLDGIQNIYFGGIMLGFSREQMKEKLNDIMAFADIGDFISQPMRTYSSGMRARLGFALAVNVNPDILIVDEVLSVGDEMFRRKCYAKMESIMDAGCTVLYVSHNSNAINQFCSRVALLDNGELLLQGPPKTVTMYYLRLMNASPETRMAVRGEIKELNKDPARKNALAHRGAGHGKKDPFADETIQRLVPFFIPELIPQSTLIQKNHDVSIDDVQLLTPGGERVNVLVMGEEYHLAFKVRFDMDAAEVSFGVVIKSQKGVNLCSCNLKGDFIPFIAKGKQATVHFYFNCNLLPGSYFCTINSSANISEQRKVLIQIQDALVFKVQADKKLENIGGLLYCDQSLEAKID
jgi:lipopolysaccharide transport system ATP-binding protein